MECDRYDSAYSFSTTMTADNGENEDDGNDDEDREDNSRVRWCRVIRGTIIIGTYDGDVDAMATAAASSPRGHGPRLMVAWNKSRKGINEKSWTKKPKKKEVWNKKEETVADGSGGRERDGTIGGSSDGRREETLPGAKKYFQPLAFNY
ncbi:hypothetical protein EAG_03573 [Camponotus floridanus]|uniref:Uncharacterized protein n=1 Tax=Camponotus floridanus TaxID=104421 RepID=E2ANX1_CAMFO|nr:hypothetical protein EAG_03573 [Camponotus floridanus]